jgi:hypothetical protein
MKRNIHYEIIKNVVPKRNNDDFNEFHERIRGLLYLLQNA